MVVDLSSVTLDYLATVPTVERRTALLNSVCTAKQCLNEWSTLKQDFDADGMQKTYAVLHLSPHNQSVLKSQRASRTGRHKTDANFRIEE
jgi:hypothetical protein